MTMAMVPSRKQKLHFIYFLGHIHFSLSPLSFFFLLKTIYVCI